MGWAYTSASPESSVPNTVKKKENKLLVSLVYIFLIIRLQQVSTPSFQYPSLSQGQLNESQMVNILSRTFFDPFFIRVEQSAD